MNQKRNSKKFKLILILLILITTILPIISIAAPATGENESVGKQIRDGVAMWFVIARYFAISAMLLVLLFLGIKLALNTLSAEKALYKQMLADWVVGFAMIFLLPYFMILILKINEALIDIIEKIGRFDEKGIGLYQTVRTRSYSMKFSVGTPAFIMYMFLVYYTVKYLVIYLKRYINIAILTITGPIVCMLHTFQKIKSGKGMYLNKWFEEYTINVLIQTVHALIYVVFIGTAIRFAEDNFIYTIIAILALNFMSKADKIFRKIFKLGGNTGAGDGGLGELTEPFKATKALMTGAAIKGVSDSAKKFAKRKGGEFLDRRIENILDRERNKISDDDVIEKENQRDKAKKDYTEAVAEKADELGISLAENKDLAANMARINAIPEIKEKLDIFKKADKEYQKFNNIKNRYAEIGPDGKARTIRRDMHYDSFGNEIGGRSISKLLYSDFERKVFGSKENKEQIKKLTKMGGKAIVGMGKAFISVPMIIEQPSVGLALLANARKDMKPLFGKPKTNVSALEMFKLKKANRTLRKPKTNYSSAHQNSTTTQNIDQTENTNKTQKFTFNRFDKTALANIEKSLYTMNYEHYVKRIANIMSRLENPNLTAKVFTTPLRLTGVMNVGLNLGSFVGNIAKEKEKEEIKLDRQFRVIAVENISKEYHQVYKDTTKKIQEDAQNASAEMLIRSEKIRLGQITQIDDSTSIQFNSNKSILSKSRAVDFALVNVAIDMKISDISKLNINNANVRDRLIKELEKRGTIGGSEKLTEEQKAKLFKVLENRKTALINDDNNCVKEKLIQNIIIESVIENNVENAEELKTEENITSIKGKVYEVFEIKDEEEKEQINDLIASVMSETEILKSDSEIKYTEDERELINLDLLKGQETKTKEEGQEEKELEYALLATKNSEENSKKHLEFTQAYATPEEDREVNSELDEALLSLQEKITNMMSESIKIEGETIDEQEDIRSAYATIGLEDATEELTHNLEQTSSPPETLEAVVERINRHKTTDSSSISEDSKLEIHNSQENEMQSVLDDLRSTFAISKVLELDNEIKETEKKLDNMLKDKTTDPILARQRKINLEEIIPEQNGKFTDVLNKIIEERVTQDRAQAELGIRNGTKEYKTIQKIYQKQRENTISSKEFNFLQIEKVIDEINLKETGDDVSE